MTALALQASSENDSGLPLLGGSGGGGDLAPSNQLNNGGADAVGDPAGGVGSKGGSSVLQGGGSRGGMGSRKSSGFDPVRTSFGSCSLCLHRRVWRPSLLLCRDKEII